MISFVICLNNVKLIFQDIYDSTPPCNVVTSCCDALLVKDEHWDDDWDYLTMAEGDTNAAKQTFLLIRNEAAQSGNG